MDRSHIPEASEASEASEAIQAEAIEAEAATSGAGRTMPLAMSEAAFFDLDKTIVSRSSSLALSRPLYRAGMVSRGQLLRGAYAQLVYLLVGADEMKMERLKEGMLQLTKGWDRGQVERLVQEVILEVIDPYVYQEALDLIELHRSEGRRIYIVSSSPEEVVRPLARHFGVSGVIATRAQVGPDNRYTGTLEFYAYGQRKAEAIRELADRVGLDLSGSYAYSDSATDIPMLAVVGHPVAVNPDRELRQHADQHGWEVRVFRRPVRLRSRLASAVPGPKGSIVAAAVGVAAVGALLVWVAIKSRPPREDQDEPFMEHAL
jgi:HAD superfamily hydrolase (TIGR01490 family)